MIFEVAAKSKAAEAAANFVQMLAGTDKPAKKAGKMSLPMFAKFPMLRKK